MKNEILDAACAHSQSQIVAPPPPGVCQPGRHVYSLDARHPYCVCGARPRPATRRRELWWQTGVTIVLAALTAFATLNARGHSSTEAWWLTVLLFGGGLVIGWLFGALHAGLGWEQFSRDIHEKFKGGNS